MDINLNKQSEQHSFKTKEDVIKDINSAPAWENENLNDRESLSKEKKSYFERMINNSKDENLMLKYRQSQLQVDALDMGFDAVELYPEQESERHKLVNRLPVAKKEGKWTSSENKELDKFKKEHKGADLCTLREYEGLTEYFKDGGFAGFVPKGADENAEVKEFIESIMDTEVTMGLFNDDYLSQHVSELYDYTLKLKNIPELEKKYPEYFNSLSTAKRAVLEAKVNCADEIEEVLISHMRLHGISILKGKDGYEAKLVKYPDSKSFMELDKRNSQFNYNRALNDLADKMNNKAVVKTAEVFVKGEAYTKENAVKNVEEKAASDPENYNLFREQFKYAFGAIKRAGDIRDEIIESLKDLIKKSKDKYISEEERENARIKIRNANRKILVVSRHIEYYGEYIDFLNGKTGNISKSTKEFLYSDGDSSVMETLWALQHVEENLEEDDPGVRDEFLKMIKRVRENADFMLVGLDNAED